MLRTADSSSHTQLAAASLSGYEVSSAGLPSASAAADRLGGEHARLHRGVRALDLRHVEEPGGVADQRAAREGQLRDRLQAALVQRPRAVADAPPALEMLAHLRMRLEALHLVERRQPGVAVVEADDEAVRDQIVRRNDTGTSRHRSCCRAASRSCARSGPACGRSAGISHSSLMPMRVGLRIVALAQLVALDQLSWSASRGSPRRTACRCARSSMPR